MAAPYCAGCRTAAIAAIHPPADRPIVAHASRFGITLKCWPTQAGTSRVSQVSTCGSPAGPFTPSVSTPFGISICGMTMSGSRIRCSCTRWSTKPGTS
jgi:hypothetical protein